MFDKLRAMKHGRLAAKAGITLCQRFMQYFFDRGITPSNDDNLLFARECCTLMSCLTVLHHSQNIFEKYEYVHDVSTMAISLTKSWVRDVMSGAGVQSDLIAQLSSDFEGTSMQKSAEWFLFLRASFPEGYENKLQTYNAAVGLFAGRIQVWSEFDSELPVPQELEAWASRVVTSEIQKYGLLPEVAGKL